MNAMYVKLVMHAKNGQVLYSIIGNCNLAKWTSKKSKKMPGIHFCSSELGYVQFVWMPENIIV